MRSDVDSGLGFDFGYLTDGGAFIEPKRGYTAQLSVGRSCQLDASIQLIGSPFMLLFSVGRMTILISDQAS